MPFGNGQIANEMHRDALEIAQTLGDSAWDSVQVVEDGLGMWYERGRGEALDPVQRLSRDLREAAETLSEDEARYLVAAYYNLQEERIRCDAQVRKLKEGGKPQRVIGWLADQSRTLERQIKAALDRFSANHRFGTWPRSITGVGPVLAAGLIAHTDMDHLPTAGHLWSFAGLNPETVWGAGQKRPWNADLKVLCWKIGQSFMKLRSFDGDVYLS